VEVAMSRLAAALLIISASTAAAQPAGNLELDSFHPAMDARGFLTLNGSETLDDHELSFGLGSLEWGRHMLSFQNGPMSYSIDDMVSATLVAALGLRLGVPFELGVSVPVSIMSGDRGPQTIDPSNPNNDKTYRVDGQGLGNTGLHVKARLGRAGGFGFGAIASVYLPTATKDGFFGDTGYSPQLTGVVDRGFGPFRVAVNAGVRLRPTETFTDTGYMSSPATMGTITRSSDAPVGIAAAWALVPSKLEAIAEASGAIPLGPHHGYQTLEALGGLKLYLAKSSYLTLGAGRGLLPDQAGNPDLRAFIGIVFEPSSGDRAHVHVYEETPEPEPREPEKVADRDEPCDPHAREDCPDRTLVIDTGSEIVTLQSIEFEFDKDVIRPISYPILDAVAKALTDNPDIELVEVAGHTDERGSAAYNLDLSRRRAAAVERYLVDHGIDTLRLMSNGYGLTRPLDKRHIEVAWTKNRRVEFVILQRK
jgi:outer membrane protein OmpA-like peptidoglycan-associated protein